MSTKEAIDNTPAPSVPGGKHPILVNSFLILALAAIGLLIVYFSLALFTKHGQTAKVPGVENLSYAAAVEKLHNAGFRVEIRDSLYIDNIRPGLVIEQFPKSGEIAKPGRKIFLYINALHPKQVMIDEENRPGLNALRGLPSRSAIARLQELGFKHIKIVKVLGSSKDLVVRVLADGRPVRKRQYIPVSAYIVVEVYDGRLEALYDSLYNLEMANDPTFSPSTLPPEGTFGGGGESGEMYSPSQTEEAGEQGTYQYIPEENSGGEGGNSSEPEPETLGI